MLPRSSLKGVFKLMRTILKGDFSAKIKGNLSYNFFSKPLPLQVTAFKIRGGLFLFNISTMEEFIKMKFGR